MTLENQVGKFAIASGNAAHGPTVSVQRGRTQAHILEQNQSISVYHGSWCVVACLIKWRDCNNIGKLEMSSALLLTVVMGQFIIREKMKIDGDHHRRPMKSSKHGHWDNTQNGFVQSLFCRTQVTFLFREAGHHSCAPPQPQNIWRHALWYCISFSTLRAHDYSATGLDHSKMHHINCSQTVAHHLLRICPFLTFCLEL